MHCIMKESALKLSIFKKSKPGKMLILKRFQIWRKINCFFFLQNILENTQTWLLHEYRMILKTF